MNFNNPIVLILGAIFLLAILYFWNKRNATKQRQRKNKNFRSSYYERKKERKMDEKDEL